MSRPTSREVSSFLVEGLIADGVVPVLRPDLEEELVRRIADVVQGERDQARRVFDFYDVPFDVPGTRS